MMTALLRKDFRVNRAVILGNAILVVAAYVVVAIAGFFTDGPIARWDVREAIIGAAYAGLVITAVLATVYGAIAFAQERQDHSANFLAMVPVRRGRIVLSKFIVAVACMLAFCMFSLAVIFITVAGDYFTLRVDHFLNQQAFDAWVSGLCFGVMVFGVAWMCSAFLQSPAIAAAISIGACIFTNILIAQIIQHMVKNRELAANLSAAVSLGIGLCSLIVGTIYYLRRIEP